MHFDLHLYLVVASNHLCGIFSNLLLYFNWILKKCYYSSIAQTVRGGLLSNQKLENAKINVVLRVIANIHPPSGVRVPSAPKSETLLSNAHQGSTHTLMSYSPSHGNIRSVLPGPHSVLSHHLLLESECSLWNLSSRFSLAVLSVFFV